MNKLTSYSDIQGAIMEIKKIGRGFITNLYLEEEKMNIWIATGKLYKIDLGDMVFFLRFRNDFAYLYYCAPSIISLSHSLFLLKKIVPDTLLVIDIIGKEPDVSTIVKVFEEQSFYLYTILNRMSRRSIYNYSETDFQNIIVADHSKVEGIYNILYCYFDPLAEQLPAIGEIKNWITKNNILIFEEKNEIIGMLIYELNGMTSYLRYWFVHPGYRDRKIGAALLKKYFKQSLEAKRQLFWVINTNNNAIKRYEHYGFNSENLFDYVLTNKNIHYETSNH